MRVLVALLTTVLLCSLVAHAGESHAQSPAVRYEKLRARYSSLRNTDIQVKKIAEWVTLERELQTFAREFPKAKEAPQAWYAIAVLDRELFRHHGEREYFERALAALEALRLRYPGDPLADDALLEAGDLHDYAGETEAADRSYAQLAADFPHSELVALAAQRRRAGSGSTLTRAHEGESSASGESGGPIIVLDPGHGGEDTGAVGEGGLLEKDVTLAIALEAQALLKQRLGATVYLTRRTDTFVPLAVRTAFANEKGASIFVSLHMNASPEHRLHGVESYVLDNTNDKASHLLASRENESVRYEGAEADLTYMLSDLIQSAKLDESTLLATTIQRGVVGALRRGGASKTADLGVKRAPFYVLVGAHMPCTLVELGFIDYPGEGRRFGEKAIRRQVAEGLVNGIREFFAGKDNVH